MKGVKFVSLLIVVAMFAFSCGPSAEDMEQQRIADSIAQADSADSIAKIAHVQQESAVPKGIKIYSANSIGLTSGRVMDMDCKNMGKSDQDLTDNYVTIRNSEGVCEIFRDIDADVFLNLQPGDSLR